MIDIRPYITEKTVKEAKAGRFTLLVSGSSSKPQISLKIKQYFKVNPLSVKIINQKEVISKNAKGVKKTSRGFKKAIIELKKGESIPGYAPFTEVKEKDKKEKGKS